MENNTGDKLRNREYTLVKKPATYSSCPLVHDRLQKTSKCIADLSNIISKVNHACFIYEYNGSWYIFLSMKFLH